MQVTSWEAIICCVRALGSSVSNASRARVRRKKLDASDVTRDDT